MHYGTELQPEDEARLERGKNVVLNTMMDGAWRTDEELWKDSGWPRFESVTRWRRMLRKELKEIDPHLEMNSRNRNGIRGLKEYRLRPLLNHLDFGMPSPVCMYKMQIIKKRINRKRKMV